MTLIAVPIMVESLEHGLAGAARAAEHGADLVEFRVDRFAAPAQLPQVRELVEKSALPCILTCRPTWEGGHYEGDEENRLAMLELVGQSARPPAYIDFELAAYQRSREARGRVDQVVDHPGQTRKTNTGLILSSHDFTGRPPDLIQRLEAMANAPACRVMKLAWKARSLRDNLEAFEILAQRHKPAVVLCMGEEGLPSRVLAKKFGALFTFAALDEKTGTAPGQPTVAQLKELYRWDKITPQTRVYGVIGHPVGHSMSPAIHNAGFDALEGGFDGVYLPMPIPPEYEHFKATVGAWLDFAPLHFRGASVTIPHKENLLRFAREWTPKNLGSGPGAPGSDLGSERAQSRTLRVRSNEIEPLSERIGAANTLQLRDDGSLYVCNTDYAAALGAVCAGLAEDPARQIHIPDPKSEIRDPKSQMPVWRQTLTGRRVAVLGAGGAARAIVAGFAQSGATVVIYNRTPANAQALASHFADYPGAGAGAGKIVVGAMDKLADRDCQVYINCTPVGMYPHVDQSPVPADFFTKDLGGKLPASARDAKGQVLVFDTIYNPAQTRLLREAAAAGCKTVAGTEMFVRQAAGQFELWTGRQAPMEIFRQVLSRQLGG